MLNRKKVVLGLSGGVDSSTTAFLLKEKGYEIVGVTLVCSENQRASKDLEDAKLIANKLGIKHIVLDIVDEFNEKIVDYFVKEYSIGNTPSPCVICDEIIKIKKLLEVADEEKAYYISTGHYCKINRDNDFGVPLLEKAKDERKDQGYMLYRIEPQKLDRILFPLEIFEKKEVREKAEKFGLEVHKKPDSQGICFAKEGYIEFLKNKLNGKIKKGNYIDKNGKILGQHQGYQLYTIGQRRGLGVIFSKIYFIVDIFPERNEILLGDYVDLNKKIIELEEFKSHIPIHKLKELRLLGKARFSSQGFFGRIVEKENRIYFEFEEENPHNARGQHLVLYYENFVLGGGKINF